MGHSLIFNTDSTHSQAVCSELYQVCQGIVSCDTHLVFTGTVSAAKWCAARLGSFYYTGCLRGVINHSSLMFSLSLYTTTVAVPLICCRHKIEK